MTECQGCGAWNNTSRTLCVLCGTPLAETDEWDAAAELPPLPPLPDGGLRASMPTWLREAPERARRGISSTEMCSLAPRPNRRPGAARSPRRSAHLPHRRRFSPSGSAISRRDGKSGASPRGVQRHSTRRNWSDRDAPPLLPGRTGQIQLTRAKRQSALPAPLTVAPGGAQCRAEPAFEPEPASTPEPEPGPDATTGSGRRRARRRGRPRSYVWQTLLLVILLLGSSSLRSGRSSPTASSVPGSRVEESRSRDGEKKSRESSRNPNGRYPSPSWGSRQARPLLS